MLIAILAALVGFGFFGIWRASAAIMAARALVDVAGDAHGLWRHFFWRRKFASDDLALVKDPREAAAAMMFAVGQADGQLTEREQAAILSEIENQLAEDKPHAQELAARGRWLVRDSHDLYRSLTRMDRVLEQTQRRDVVAMLDRVALANGPPGPEVTRALDQYRRLVAASAKR
jgi:uncharacterized tellurite resistance protein B-like protein